MLCVSYLKTAQFIKTMAKHNEIGNIGEDIAHTFLIDKGMQVLERNWRYKRAELDIIAMEAETMVFIEVKTRSDDILGSPENAVDTRKRKLMIRAAIAYMHHSKHDWTIRFDIVSVILRNDKPQIDHIQDAFFPELAE